MLSLFKHCRDQKVEITRQYWDFLLLLSIASNFGMVMKTMGSLIPLDGCLPTVKRFISICRRSPLHGLIGHCLGDWLCAWPIWKLDRNWRIYCYICYKAIWAGKRCGRTSFLSWDYVGTWILYGSEPSLSFFSSMTFDGHGWTNTKKLLSPVESPLNKGSLITWKERVKFCTV